MKHQPLIFNQKKYLIDDRELLFNYDAKDRVSNYKVQLLKSVTFNNTHSTPPHSRSAGWTNVMTTTMRGDQLIKDLDTVIFRNMRSVT